MNLSPFELAGLLTHLAVFVVGLGGSVGILPLARGRRSGLGLILMALSMTVLVLQPVFQPRWLPDGWTAIGYVVGFAIALWLLIGPASPKNAGADGE